MLADKVHRDYMRNKGFIVFSTILLVYSIVFISIAIWRYENFCLHDSADLIVSEQMIYNTLHGRPFHITFEGSAYSELSIHNSPFLALLVPFAAIIPVPYVLFAFTVLSIAVSAVPIYLLARESLKNELLALLLGASYIMLPAFVGQVYQSFHGINLVLPFLTFAFYFFIKERFYPFIAMLVIALTVKEDVSLTLFMFTIYALIKKRSMKWYLIPAALSISWLIMSVKVIIPFFSKEDSYSHISYLSNVGSSFGEIIANTIFNPAIILKELMQPNKLFYLFVILLPVGLILPLFSIEIIFAIPSIFLNMLGESQRLRLIDFGASGILPLPRHMSLMATVFLFLSAIYAIQRLRMIFARHPSLVTAVLSLLLISLTTYNTRFVLRPEFYYKQSVPTPATIKRVISLIPKDATVKASIDIANHLYDRKEVYLLGNPIEADFIVLKATDSFEAEIGNRYKFFIIEKDIFLFRKK